MNSRIRNIFSTLLVSLLLLGAYTNITIELGYGLSIPAVISGVAAICILMLNFYSIPKKHVIILLAFILIAVLSLLLSPDPLRYAWDRGKGLIFLVYSIAIGYAIFWEISKWENIRIERYFFIIAIVIVFGCILEVTTPLKHLSDVFRDFAHHGKEYIADKRDISMAGFVRPKLFTSEPSHVAKYFVISLMVWYSMAKLKRRDIIYFSLAILSYLVIRSPIIFVAAPIYVILKYGLIVHQKNVLSKYIFISISALFFMLIVLFVGGAVKIGGVSTGLLGDRVDSMAHGGESSFNNRIVAPPLIAVSVLNNSPQWGVGVSGTESITDLIHKVFSDLGVYESQYKGGLHRSIINAFWLHWIYYGIMGGILTYFVLFLFMYNVRARDYFSIFLIIFLMSNLIGSPNGVIYWITVMIIIMVSCKRLLQNSPN